MVIIKYDGTVEEDRTPEPAKSEQRQEYDYLDLALQLVVPEPAPPVFDIEDDHAN